MFCIKKQNNVKKIIVKIKKIELKLKIVHHLIGLISSFLILNSGKDCKGWRSQFRSVAKE